MESEDVFVPPENVGPVEKPAQLSMFVFQGFGAEKPNRS